MCEPSIVSPVSFPWKHLQNHTNTLLATLLGLDWTQLVVPLSQEIKLTNPPQMLIHSQFNAVLSNADNRVFSLKLGVGVSDI